MFVFAAGIRGQYTVAQTLDCSEYPKKSLLKSSHPKKIIAKKIPELKISNANKSFDHPHHLKSGVPPLPLWGGDLVDIYLLPKMTIFAALLSEDTK